MLVLFIQKEKRKQRRKAVVCLGPVVGNQIQGIKGQKAY